MSEDSGNLPTNAERGFEAGRRRIAIIGGGVSGAAAAYALHEAHDIALFEASDRLGGHVRTADFARSESRTMPADMGVIIIHERAYPNLMALYEKLSVATRPIELAVQGSFGESGGYWATDCHDTPLFRELSHECRLFEDTLKERFDVEKTDFSVTLGSYCDRLGLSEAFRQKALLPLLIVLQITRSALWETPVIFIQPLFRYGTLSFFETKTGWRMIEGGSRRAIDALSSGYRDKVRLSSRVTRVERRRDATPEGRGSVTIFWDGGPPSGEIFDEVIITCSLDLAHELIKADADPIEREVLCSESFRYEPLDVFVHTDTSVITRGTKEPWFIQYNQNERGTSITFNPSLLPIPTGSEGATTPLVTYCHDKSLAPDPKKVTEQATFRHLLSTPAACQAAIAVRSINGKRHTYYAGQSCALPPNWHEGAFVSALVVAQALGVPYPFAESRACKRIFDMTQMVMGIGSA